MNPLVRMWGAITALAIGIAVSFLPQGTAEAKPGEQTDPPKATISAPIQQPTAYTSQLKSSADGQVPSASSVSKHKVSGMTISSQQVQKTHVSRLIPDGTK